MKMRVTITKTRIMMILRSTKYTIQESNFSRLASLSPT